MKVTERHKDYVVLQVHSLKGRPFEIAALRHSFDPAAEHPFKPNDVPRPLLLGAEDYSGVGLQDTSELVVTLRRYTGATDYSDERVSVRSTAQRLKKLFNEEDIQAPVTTPAGVRLGRLRTNLFKALNRGLEIMVGPA